MKKPVRNTFVLLAIPLIVAWGFSGAPSRAETVPRAKAYGTYKPEYSKSAPTRPGEIPQHIDTYTPGKMPVKPLEIPADVQARLGAAMKKIYDSKDYQGFMSSRGFGTIYADAKGFEQFMAKGDADMGTVMKALGLSK